MKRRATAIVSPDAFGTGAIGEQTATHDRYFTDLDEDTLLIVVDNFMSKLPEPQKSAVQMCIMHRYTYEEAANKLSIARGIRTDKKTVWRWAQQGVEMLGKMFEAAKWTSEISPKVPR